MIIILFFLLLAAAAYSIHSAVKYTRMISHIFLSLVYRPLPELFSSSRGEKINILDSADKEIETLFVEKKDSSFLAIFCTESGAGKESWEKYAYFLPAKGFSILSMDFKNKEDEEAQFLSQWPTQDDVNQVLTVVRWAKRAIRPDVRIVLFGVSKGADIALGASFYDSSIKAVIADGLFSMKEIFRGYIRKWAPILVKPNLFGEKYPDWVVCLFTDLGFWYSQRKSLKKFIDVEKFLSGRHAPLLMIHGTEDDYVPVSHQKFLEKIDKQKSSDRLVIQDAKHNEAVILAKEIYEQKVMGFLGANL